MKKKKLPPLRPLRIVVHSRQDMAAQVKSCWRNLRVAGYRRRTVLVAFARGWLKGSIRIEPFVPPRVVIEAKPRRAATR